MNFLRELLGKLLICTESKNSKSQQNQQFQAINTTQQPKNLKPIINAYKQTAKPIKQQKKSQSAQISKLFNQQAQQKYIKYQPYSQKHSKQYIYSSQQQWNVVTKKIPLKCNYPYTKQDAYKLFRQKNDTVAYSQKQMRKCIKNGLLDMDSYGFDFRCVEWQFVRKQQYEKREYKKFNRKIYLRYQCPVCMDNDGTKKRWTSILGNLEIKFQVQDLSKFWRQNKQFKEENVDLQQIQHPKIVKWMLYVYREYCKKCKREGQPFVFQSQVKACEMQFCRIIGQIMNQVKPEYNKGNRDKVIQVHNHQQQFCQACKLGECFNIPKQQKYQHRRHQV